MTFQDDLRSTLHAEADDLDLRGRGPSETMHLARRRQHRARRAGAVAAVGVLGVGAVGVMAARRTDGVAVTSVADQVGLPDVGPLELSWQTSPGGITGGTSGAPRFTEGGGALYALSTAPGARFSQDGPALTPALYRLADDGTWVPAGDLSSVPMVDLEGSDSVLYAFGTAPGTSGVGYDAVLSSSADGGSSWVPSSTIPVTPPSSNVLWEMSSNLAVERVPGAAVALMSTLFTPPEDLIDDLARGAGATGSGYGYEVTDAGIDIVADGGVEGGPAPTMPPTTIPPEVATDATNGTVPPKPPAVAVPTSIAPDGAVVYADDPDPASAKREPTREVITTIPWSELGVTGRGDLSTTHVLVERAGTWTPVASPALDGVSITSVVAAGQDVVVQGWDRSGSTRTFASTDGATWRPIAVGDDSRIKGLGGAWVDVPEKIGDSSPVVRSSFDQGTSWSTVDLGAVDRRLGSTSVVSFDSGALGLAAVAVDSGDGPNSISYLVTTRDLKNWTVTPLTDITGGSSAEATVHVGTDRIVVTASEGHTGDDSALPGSVTAIGTPVR